MRPRATRRTATTAGARPRRPRRPLRRTTDGPTPARRRNPTPTAMQWATTPTATATLGRPTARDRVNSGATTTVRPTSAAGAGAVVIANGLPATGESEATCARTV